MELLLVLQDVLQVTLYLPGSLPGMPTLSLLSPGHAAYAVTGII